MTNFSTSRFRENGVKISTYPKKLKPMLVNEQDSREVYVTITHLYCTREVFENILVNVEEKSIE